MGGRSYYLLAVGQLLEIIFTFFTVKVGCEPEEAPLDEVAPAPALLLGFAAELPLEGELAASDPVIRT